MDSVFIWAQLIALVAMGIRIFSVQFKKPQHILLCCVPSSILWGIQYLLLGAPMGALFDFSSAIKNGILGTIKQKYIYIIIISFLVFLWISGLYLFKSWFDILPLIAVTLIDLACLRRDNRALIMRATILGQICWIIYNFIVGSYVGTICSILVICSSIISMARYEKWTLGKCYKSFMPNLARELFIFPNFRTYP